MCLQSFRLFSLSIFLFFSASFVEGGRFENLNVNFDFASVDSPVVKATVYQVVRGGMLTHSLTIARGPDGAALRKYKSTLFELSSCEFWEVEITREASIVLDGAMLKFRPLLGDRR